MKDEVLNNYLIWELSQPIIHNLIRTTISPKIAAKLKKIEQIIENLSNIIDGNLLDFSEKINLVKQSTKSNRPTFFKNYFWTKENYDLTALGTALPKCGDLPLDIITQPFSVVVEYVRKRLERHSCGVSIRYVADLMKIPSILKKFPPIVIEPGKEQRNKRKMEEYYGQRRKWEVFPGDGYVEDGNHRAIAIVLKQNLESILCYVGKRPENTQRN